MTRTAFRSADKAGILRINKMRIRNNKKKADMTEHPRVFDHIGLL